MSRPLVLLDVDGVLGGFVEHALELLRSHVDHELTVDDVNTWEMFSSFPAHIQEHRESVYAALKGPGGCYGIPVAEGSVAGVKLLREVADVHVVTTPFEGSLTWMGERDAWLREHFGFTSKEITQTHRKDLVVGDFLVDDKVLNVETWQVARAGKGHGILWNHPHNREAKTNVLRSGSWEDVVAMVQGGYVPRKESL